MLDRLPPPALSTLSGKAPLVCSRPPDLIGDRDPVRSDFICELQLR